MNIRSRTGKIARLPREIREHLNHRLADGEIGRELVDWLNSLPEVQKVLATLFRANPITEQNLSEWKQGGFADWLRHQEARAWAQQLAEQSEDLEGNTSAVALADRAATPALFALDCILQQALSSETDQHKAVLRVCHHLVQLRRSSHDAERLRLDQERWAARKEEMRRQTIIQSYRWRNLDFNASAQPPAKSR
jgi:hypothetical protein